mmetsp:Transcript_34092/g.61455  ORF Transcript_34092/g.61455 Transcript_34092/m.61455 type:complete len:545 (-) Transcript_34092:51-1685(-)
MENHKPNLPPGGVNEGHVDRLDLGIVGEGVLTLLASDTRGLEASEGNGGIEEVVAVDPNGTGMEAADEGVDGVEVLREDAGGKTVVGGVGASDHLIEGAVLKDGLDGSEDLLPGDLHVVGDVGEDGGGDVVTLVADAAATDIQLGALGLSVLDVRQDLRELGVVDLRTLVVLAGEGVTNGVVGGGLGSLLDELVVDLLVHVHAGPGGAALAVVEEERHVRVGDGAVDIDVRADDDGGFATELKSAGLDLFSGEASHDLADLSGAGEGGLVDELVAGKRATDGGAETSYDVDDTLGEADLGGELGDEERRERGLLGGLEDDGVTGGKGRTKLPGRHEEGEVPGDDGADHSQGLVEGVGHVRAVDGDGLAVDLVGPSGVVAEVVNGERHIGDARDVEGLAVVESLEASERLSVGLQGVGELVDETTALFAGHPWPGALIEGLAGGLDGQVDVSRVTLRDTEDLFAIAGVLHAHGLAGLGVNPLVVDEELVGEVASKLDGLGGNVNDRGGSRSTASETGKGELSPRIHKGLADHLGGLLGDAKGIHD